MRYDDPELRRRLAAEYVLGTMPRRARCRFERLIAGDATLAALVAAWETRFAPLDESTPEAAPPERAWLAIEQRISGRAPQPAPARSWFRTLAFWRGATALAAAACAVLAIYVAVRPAPPAPQVVALLADKGGAPRWIALSGPQRGEVSVTAIAPLAAGKGHSFELWGIAGGPPRPLGLLAPQPGRPLLLRVAALPAAGGALAVSREPPGGSPTGQPTGPVLYQGKVLTLPR